MPAPRWQSRLCASPVDVPAGSRSGRVSLLRCAVPGRQGEGRVHAPQLVTVQRAQPRQDLLTLGGQQHPHRPAVARMRTPLYEPLPLRPIDQFHHAVVAQLEPVSELPNGRPLPTGKPFQCQQQLILLRSEAIPAHRLLAEAQIATDPETESSQRLEILLRQRFGSRPLLVHRHHNITPCPLGLSMRHRISISGYDKIYPAALPGCYWNAPCNVHCLAQSRAAMRLMSYRRSDSLR